MLVFVIRFILFSAVLYFSYILLFRSMSFFRINRYLLLSIPVISLVVPLLIPYFPSTSLGQNFLVQLPEINLIQGGESVTSDTQGLNWILIIYLAISCLMLIALLRGIFKGLQLSKKAKAAGAVRFSVEAESPFTFFNNIIIPTELQADRQLESIIDHEEVHVRQRHSWDNLYYGLLCSAAWFNPFVYLLAKELRQTHECLADEQALKKTSREEYAQLLLSSAFGREIDLSPMAMGTANPFFNSSLIKARITMIYKQKTHARKQWMYLLLVPILSGITLMSCSKTKEASSSPETTAAAEEKALNLGEADHPPLFVDCDANASKEDQMSCFTGGIMKHIMENFKYPKKASELGLEGKVMVSFVIDKTGAVTDTEIKSGLETSDEAEEAAAAEAHNEAIKLVNSLPKMAPALKDGKKVAVSFILPLSMKLE